MISNSSNDRIRIDVALIPSESLFSTVIDASQAITQQFRNNNIIDADRFPPHLSLHICTIPKNNLSLFANDVVLSNSKIVSLKPTRLSMASSGYISLEVEKSPEIYKLHERIINISARIRGSNFEEVPEKKRNYWSAQEQINYKTYGNIFVCEKFDPHFSIAKVDQENLSASFDIARLIIKPIIGIEIPISRLQICDIGMLSEKWDVLWQSDNNEMHTERD